MPSTPILRQIVVLSNDFLKAFDRVALVTKFASLKTHKNLLAITFQCFRPEIIKRIIAKAQMRPGNYFQLAYMGKCDLSYNN